MSIGFVFVVAIAIGSVVFFVRHREKAERARFLKRAGFTLMALFALLFGLFIAGETFTDPGGWEALGLVASWAIPLAVLGAITWYRPDWAIRLFAILITAVIGTSIWFAVNPEGWRSFEDRNGPIRTIIVFALTATVALLGLKRTAMAGVMLLILGIVPIAVSSLGSNLGFTSLVVATSPAVVTGILYLLSVTMTGRSVPPRSGETGSEERPKAA